MVQISSSFQMWIKTNRCLVRMKDPLLIDVSFSDLYKLALFGIFFLAEALQNLISIHAASSLAIRTQVS